MKQKQLFYFIIFISAIASCTTDYKTNSKAITSIQFNNSEHDFGNIKMNTLTSTEFKFSNTGKKSLIISRVVANCGCAEPEWPKKPIKPGRTGIINLKYDTSHPGRFIKTLTVYANVENSPIELKVMGVIE